jgi:nucleoid DNA-binding protein
VNVQQVIIEGLRQQLYHHQFIVLPGFGGFVLKTRPAFFSATGLQLHPPSKNDGILTSWLQKKQGISAAQAFDHLTEFASYCRGVLEHRRRLTLPGIGFFHLDLENNLGFEPQPDQNFLATSFGLTAINLPADQDQHIVPLRKAVFEDRRITLTTQRTGVRKKLQAALTPLLLLGTITVLLLLLVSVTNFRGELRAALAGMSTESRYNAHSYQELSLVTPDTLKTAMIPGSGGISYVRLGRWSLPVKATVAEARYQIVLGCFAKRSNATKLIRQLRRHNISAHISEVPHRGMAVVCYGAYTDKVSALNDLGAVQAVVPQAWIKGN